MTPPDIPSDETNMIASRISLSDKDTGFTIFNKFPSIILNAVSDEIRGLTGNGKVLTPET